MATIKSYTDISQSKALSKILPLESADMCYILHASSDNPDWRFDNDIPPMVLGKISINELTVKALPCWSLAALFNILPDGTNIIKDEADTENEKCMCVAESKDDIISTFGNNPVDACYEMILKLHEMNLL